MYSSLKLLSIYARVWEIPVFKRENWKKLSSKDSKLLICVITHLHCEVIYQIQIIKEWIEASGEEEI